MSPEHLISWHISSAGDPNHPDELLTLALERRSSEEAT
jgi:hypothetical protein